MADSSQQTEVHRLVDRTRAIDFQRCPRRRFWGWEFMGRGIRRIHEAIPLLLGSEVHHGVEILFQGGDVEAAIEAARGQYFDTVHAFGLELEPSEDAAYVAYEQAALLEAHLRLFALRSLPAILEEYDLLEVEHEDVTPLVGNIDWMSRPDALLREKATSDLHIYSLKTKALWDKRSDDQNRHDMQGVSEAFGVETRLGTAPSAIKMEFLLKGRREEYPADSGRYQQSSPLIRGYRKRGITSAQDEYAWRYNWKDELGNSHRLGKGWEKFDAWADGEMGVRAWIALLNTGRIQLEAGDALDSQRVTPVPYFRQDYDKDDWLAQITSQESAISSSVDVLSLLRVEGSAEAFRARLNEWFPQHKHSCSYPSRCPFQEVCFNAAIAADPIGSGQYRLREPHHETEREAFDE